MEILFLDDCPLRAMKFRREFPNATIVTTAQACIEQLTKQAWDTVFLDHDLNGDSYQDPTEENCGTTVANWINTNKPTITTVIVHSLNEIERGKMVETIRAAHYNVMNCSFLRLMQHIDSIKKVLNYE